MTAAVAAMVLVGAAPASAQEDSFTFDDAAVLGPVHVRGDAAHVQVRYSCDVGNYIWVSAKQSDAADIDPAVAAEGFGCDSTDGVWWQSHRGSFTRDGKRHTARYTVDSVEEGSRGQLTSGWAWLQFCVTTDEGLSAIRMQGSRVVSNRSPGPDQAKSRGASRRALFRLTARRDSGGVFAPIRDGRKRYQAVTMNREFGTVEWPGGIDLDPDVFRETKRPRQDQRCARIGPRISGRALIAEHPGRRARVAGSRLRRPACAPPIHHRGGRLTEEGEHEQGPRDVEDDTADLHDQQQRQSGEDGNGADGELPRNRRWRSRPRWPAVHLTHRRLGSLRGPCAAAGRG
jgi:hypothetical protein